MRCRIFKKTEFENNKAMTYYYPQVQYNREKTDFWFALRENDHPNGDIIKSTSKEYVEMVLEEWYIYMTSKEEFFNIEFEK